MRSEGSHPHTELPSPECQCWEEESPLWLAVKISRGLTQVRQRAAGDPGMLLKDHCMDLLLTTHSL